MLAHLLLGHGTDKLHIGTCANGISSILLYVFDNVRMCQPHTCSGPGTLSLSLSLFTSLSLT